MKFNIGQKVWYAERDVKRERVRCPECFGLKVLTVILGDQSEVTIDCAGCSSGIEKPKGFLEYFKQSASCHQITITKIEIKSEGAEYGCHECYSLKEDELFLNQESAEIRALELAEEWNRGELDKINRKEKNDRKWSWHVHYHRKCIRDAEKALIYHNAKLNVAREKSKEEKAV